MSELKNTPWKVCENTNGISVWYQLLDTKDNVVAEYMTLDDAESFAALPETLAELERVKDENNKLKEQINEEVFEEENEFNHLNETIDLLNHKLTQAEKERDELKKAFEDTITELEERMQNIIDNKSAMPQFMQEGGVMAFESSIDVVKYNLKKALEE